MALSTATAICTTQSPKSLPSPSTPHSFVHISSLSFLPYSVPLRKSSSPSLMTTFTNASPASQVRAAVSSMSSRRRMNKNVSSPFPLPSSPPQPNTAEDTPPTYTYKLTPTLTYDPSHVTTLAIIKRGPLLDSTSPLATQLHILNLFGSDETPYESLHAVISCAMKPYFEAFVGARGGGKDGDSKMGRYSQSAHTDSPNSRKSQVSPSPRRSSRNWSFLCYICSKTSRFQRRT